MQIKKIDFNKIFIIFLITHLLIWTIIPSVSNNNLPLDTIEALAWGSNLDWGFNKHPPLSAFTVEIFYKIFGSQDWAYYLLSQIFVIFSFLIIWIFSKEFFRSETYSFISVLLLEGVYFYNFTTPEFNVNVCMMPFWALSVLYCWRGFQNNKNLDWLLFGTFAAFGILSKYLFIYLGFAFDLFLIYMIFKKKINFKCLISLVPFLFILLPHLIWLIENDYATISYGLHRTGAGDQNFLNHFIQPLIFLFKQIGLLIPLFLMFAFLISKIKIKYNFKDNKLIYLIFINILPILLIFLTSAFMGVKIRTMWMTPFYLFLGVLIVYIFKAQINLNKFKNFLLVFLVLFILSPSTYLYISITETDKRTDYNGKEIANNIQKIWNKKYKSEIIYVKGDEWHAGNLSYHLKSRPKWLSIDSEKIISSKDMLDITRHFFMLPNEKKIPIRLYGDK